MLSQFKITTGRTFAPSNLALGKITCITGAPQKRTLLDALGVVGASLSGVVDVASLAYRGVSPVQLWPPRVLESCVTGWGATCDTLLMPVSDRWEYLAEFVSVGGDSLLRRRPQDNLSEHQGLIALHLVLWGANHPAYQLVRAMQQFCIYDPQMAVLSGVIADPQLRKPLGLYGGGVRQLHQGDAALRLEAIQCVAKSPHTPPVVGWRDLGDSLPSNLARELASSLTDIWDDQKQLIFTTNNEAFVDAFPRNHPDCRLFRVTDPQDGECFILPVD